VLYSYSVHATDYLLVKFENSEALMAIPMNDENKKLYFFRTSGIESQPAFTKILSSVRIDESPNSVKFLADGGSYIIGFNSQDASSDAVTNYSCKGIVTMVSPKLSACIVSHKDEILSIVGYVEELLGKAKCVDVNCSPEPYCEAGGYGSTSCSITFTAASIEYTASVSCGDGYYSCCNPGSKAPPRIITEFCAD